MVLEVGPPEFGRVAGVARSFNYVGLRKAGEQHHLDGYDWHRQTVALTSTCPI